MNITRPSLFSVVACLMALFAAARANPPASPKKQGFDACALVQTRNIFDPERQADAPVPGAAAAKPSTPAPSNNDFAALTGTLITTEKSLAFFSGSRPEFNKVLTPGGVLAGAALVKISPDSIEVERSGKRMVIAVGQTVPLDASSSPAPAPSSPADTTPAASSAPDQSPDRDAVMRRMMKKRQQELK